MSIGPWQLVVVGVIALIIFAPRIPGMLDGLRRGVERLDPEAAARQDREDAERAEVEAARPQLVERAAATAARALTRLGDWVRTRLRR